jgi:hypothetical protein
MCLIHAVRKALNLPQKQLPAFTGDTFVGLTLLKDLIYLFF